MKHEGPEEKIISEKVTYSVAEVHRMKARLDLISSVLLPVINEAVLVHKAIGFARTIQDVVGELSFLQSSEANRIERLQYLEMMEGSAKELLESIVLGRSHRIQAPISRVCLYDLTQEFFLQEFPIAVKKGIRVNLMREKQAPLYVNAHPWALKQVLHILAENAVQAMEKTSVKDLTASVEASNTGDIIFRVRDSGSGIPDDLKDKLFKTALLNEYKNGRGLGTALAAILIGHYDGEICIEKTSEAGTCIKIALPVSSVE